MWSSLVAIALWIAWATAQASPVVIRGVATGVTGSGQRPARSNINSVYEERGETWDLFILALARFQAAPEAQELSYFQIAGIHGLPFYAWNGVGQAPGAPLAGYCKHGQLDFGTWHRPYLALYEQILVGFAQTIAREYVGNQAPAYIAAAQALRLPFWDWGVDSNLPEAVIYPNVTVNGPHGSVTMANPLYAYRYQQLPVQGPGVGGPLAQGPETVRWPEGDGVSNSTAADEQLAYSGLKQSVYSTFTRAPNFESMVTTASPGPSFESPHNAVHNDAGGGGGDMEDINWSAMDPLFWLHHCNVDRYIALWQCIHYNNSMFNSTASSFGQFSTPPGAVISPDSPLEPFYADANGTFWTSRMVTQIKTFGYTYPEINDWSTSPSELASDVTAQVNQLYGTNSFVSRRTSLPDPRRRPSAVGDHVDYSAEIVVERSDVDVPSSVNCMLGSKIVGRMVLLAMPTSGMAHASVPLREVVEQQHLRDLTANTVIPFLRQNLVIKITKRDGTVIPVDSVPSLQVTLRAQAVTPRRNDREFPRYGNSTNWPLITPYRPPLEKEG